MDSHRIHPHCIHPVQKIVTSRKVDVYLMGKKVDHVSTLVLFPVFPALLQLMLCLKAQPFLSKLYPSEDNLHHIMGWIVFQGPVFCQVAAYS